MSDYVEEIPLAQIEVGERLRDVDGDAMRRIARSMADQGLITPIEVLKTAPEHFRLVAGAHRLAAAHDLGWGTIRAVVFNGDELSARLREIDENLHRAELTPYDEATFLGMRWHLWEQINGAPKRGGDRRSIDWRGSNFHAANLKKARENPDFYQETADTLGVSEATVRRAVRRRLALDGYWNDLREHVAKGADLDALVSLRNDALPRAVDLIVEGHSVEDAIGVAKGPRRQRDDEAGQALKALRKAWKNAKPGIRRAFLNEIGATIQSSRTEG